jgi:hypothetical protein
MVRGGDGMKVYSITQAANALNMKGPTLRFWIRTKRLNATLTPRGYSILDTELKSFKETYKKLGRGANVR